MSDTENWSSKKAKKAGQAFRREARGVFEEYQESLFKKIEEVRVIIRPRPRWIHRKIWLWLGDFFVDLNNANKALVFETPPEFLTRKHTEAVAREKAKSQIDKINYDEVPDRSENIEDLIDDEDFDEPADMGDFE